MNPTMTAWTGSFFYAGVGTGAAQVLLCRGKYLHENSGFEKIVCAKKYLHFNVRVFNL